MSLNEAVTLSTIAFLTLMARLTFLDALYVPEFRTILPENQPVTIALTMLVYMILVGGWVWSLLAAARGRQDWADRVPALQPVDGIRWGSVDVDGLVSQRVRCPTSRQHHRMGKPHQWIGGESPRLASSSLADNRA